MYHDADAGDWHLSAAGFAIEVGASSRDIRLSETSPCFVQVRPSRRLTIDSQPKFVSENPKATAAVMELLSKRLWIDKTEALSIMELTRDWFLGVHQALSWYVGDDLSVDEFRSLLNRFSDEAVTTNL